MKRVRLLLIGLALAAVLALSAACDTEGADGGGASGGRLDTAGLLQLLSSQEAMSFAGSLVPSLGLGGSQQAGIWVSGIGTVSLQPDLALLSLGVETRAKTVAEASAEAATAMTAIIEALKAQGIADEDIRTQYFNVSPEYTYQEVYEDGFRHNKQVLTGYRVTNNVTAKVWDLDTVGAAIDEMVIAGGDATRIQSIRFTVDDASAAQILARESAVEDALAKAEQFATLTGNDLGDLLYIAETGSSTSAVQDSLFRSAYMEGAPAPVTPISIGELDVVVTVQAVFDIDSP